MIQSHARSSETSYLLFLSTSPTTWRKLPYLCRITLLRPITPTHRDSNLLTWAADLARKRFLRGGFEPAFCRLEKVGTSRVSVPQYQAFGGMDFTWTYGISKGLHLDPQDNDANLFYQTYIVDASIDWQHDLELSQLLHRLGKCFLKYQFIHIFQN